MKVKVFFIVITMFLFPFNLLANQSAETWLNSKGKYLIETFGIDDEYVKHDRLDKVLLEDIDIDYVSRFVMGKYYKQLSPEQENRYLKAFEDYALYTYKKFPLSYGSDLSFIIKEIYKNNSFINARVEISPDNQNFFSVEFVLKPFENTYKIVDIKVLESSLILAYRSRFYEMIAQSDEELDWFIEDLENLSKEEHGA